MDYPVGEAPHLNSGRVRAGLSPEIGPELARGSAVGAARYNGVDPSLRRA
jgi:hypothetical protein